MAELPQLPPRCIHLQATTLAVHGEGFADKPEFQDDLTDCRCEKTGRPLGPDSAPVSLSACRNPDRDCYEEY